MYVFKILFYLSLKIFIDLFILNVILLMTIGILFVEKIDGHTVK